METARDKLVRAAADVMRADGLAKTTTKQIAKTAGYSEATLYKHFASKEELFLAVLHEQLPQFQHVLSELPDNVGKGSVSARLERLAVAAVPYFAQIIPITMSLFAEPELLASHANALRARGAGPHRPAQEIANYLRAEQKHGRIRASARPESAAAMLLGGCFQRAFLATFMAQRLTDAEVRRFAKDLVLTLFTGIKPLPAKGKP